MDGVLYTEVVFSDITELHNKNLELKAQIKQLMRECLTNSVRHAGATTIYIIVEKKGDSVSFKLTNDGRTPGTEVIPKGGLHNLYRHIMDLGGTMEIQSKPDFVLTVLFPVIKKPVLRYSV